MANEINYNKRRFRAIANSPNGEVDGVTFFEYYQEGNVLWGTYRGANILFGTITGLVEANGDIEFSYQHVNIHNEIMTGVCNSTPEIMKDGRIRLHEKWQWTCKDKSNGESVIEEIASN
ncbi:MAG: n-acetylglutamate synthase [Bacteroidota bacterium]